MAQFTGLIYDDCYVCDEAKQNESAANYVFDSMPFERNTRCVEVGGTVGGSTANSATTKTKASLVDIDSAMRGVYPVTGDCPYYNRDHVNAGLTQLEGSVVEPPYCDLNTEPIHTRLDCHPDLVSDRIFEMNIPSQHPWQRGVHQPGINTQELARSVYNEMNPTDKCGCSGPVPHKQ